MSRARPVLIFHTPPQCFALTCLNCGRQERHTLGPRPHTLCCRSAPRTCRPAQRYLTTVAPNRPDVTCHFIKCVNESMFLHVQWRLYSDKPPVDGAGGEALVVLNYRLSNTYHTDGGTQFFILFLLCCRVCRQTTLNNDENDARKEQGSDHNSP